MPTNLQVALGIVDAIKAAQCFHIPLDVEAQSRILSQYMPVPALTREMIAEALVAEGRDAGVRLA